jgi:hypothetical protein
MTREEQRIALWVDAYKLNIQLVNNDVAAKRADEVLTEFDKRFPATSAKFQTHTLTLDEVYERLLNNPTSVKPPNNTSELGVMLDTERTWINCKEKTPESVHIEYEVMYMDKSTDLGWFSDPDWFTKKDSVYGLDKAGKWSETEKTVVAWRELPK